MKVHPFGIVADLALTGANAVMIDSDNSVVCVSYETLSALTSPNVYSLTDPNLLEQLKKVTQYDYKFPKERLVEVATTFRDKLNNWHLRNAWWIAPEIIASL